MVVRVAVAVAVVRVVAAVVAVVAVAEVVVGVAVHRHNDFQAVVDAHDFTMINFYADWWGPVCIFSTVSSCS